MLTAPDNGRVTWNGITNGSTATYTCDKGYELIGDRTRTCLNTGEWSGQEPNCTGTHFDNKCLTTFCRSV